jgi:hypothetical protein
MIPSLQTTRTLSRLLALLALLASLGGLLLPDLYRDKPAYELIWKGNDAVTLALIVPALLVCIERAGRDQVVARLVWLGLLAYLVYNYAFYLFGAAFNAFFLLYVALFAGALFTLFIALWQLDVAAVARRLTDGRPLRWIAVYLAVIAAILLSFEGGMSAAFWFTGEVPKPPSLIFALDLSFVLPYMLLAAGLLWRRRVWGYVLGAMMLVKGITYGTVLSVNALLLSQSALPDRDPFWPFYLFVALGSLAGLVALLQKPRAIPAAGSDFVRSGVRPIRPTKN